jgi:hypothetical protein
MAANEIMLPLTFQFIVLCSVVFFFYIVDDFPLLHFSFSLSFYVPVKIKQAILASRSVRTEILRFIFSFSNNSNSNNNKQRSPVRLA